MEKPLKKYRPNVEKPCFLLFILFVNVYHYVSDLVGKVFSIMIEKTFPTKSKVFSIMIDRPLLPSIIPYFFVKPLRPVAFQWPAASMLASHNYEERVGHRGRR